MKNYSFIALALMVIVAGCSSNRPSGSKKLAPTFLDKVTVSQMEMVNTTGQPWDADGSGPDIMIGFYAPGNQVEELMTPVKYNVKAIDLPYEWALGNKRLPMSGKTYTMILYDQDDNTKQEMARWTFSPTIEQNSIIIDDAGRTTNKILIDFLRDDNRVSPRTKSVPNPTP